MNILKRLIKFALILTISLFTLVYAGENSDMTAPPTQPIKLFFAGDVMLGRGIDQALPYSNDPILYERYIQNAKAYIQIAYRKNGKFPIPVDFDYIWGDALKELDQYKPDLRLINLENSITTHSNAWGGKGIHYRMHPKNIDVLKSAKIDYCSLANNHVLDWGFDGLIETIDTLNKANIKSAGAGKDKTQAQQPAVFELKDSRVVIFSVGVDNSGISPKWAAADNQPGVFYIRNYADKYLKQLVQHIKANSQANDIVILSIHWGGNWGYNISNQEQKFAKALIDQAGVDIIHGHSSHHPKGIEVYNNKLIMYGLGDFFNDYEGIRGHDEYRGDLTFMYLVEVEPKTQKLYALRLVPMQIKHFKLNRASETDTLWLKNTLNKASSEFELEFVADKNSYLKIKLDTGE